MTKDEEHTVTTVTAALPPSCPPPFIALFLIFFFFNLSLSLGLSGEWSLCGGVGHCAPQRSQGNGDGRCLAWPPGDGGWSPGGSEGRRRGRGGVSPGVRKVLGGHQGGAPGLPGGPGGKGLQMCERRAPAGGSRWPPSEHLGRLPPYPSGTACPPPQRPVLPPGSSELRGASWRPGGVRLGGRRGRESRALQSRRAAQFSERWVAWAPRPSGLVPRHGHHSRHLGLWQGPGRLGVYLTPASAPSTAPLHSSPTSELEARHLGAPVTGLARPRGRLCQSTPDTAGSSPWVSSIPTRGPFRPPRPACGPPSCLFPKSRSCLQRDPLSGL